MLTNYAFILSSQGNLQTALHYLGNSQNEQVSALRERLFVALGQRSAYNETSSRKSSLRTSFSSYPNTYLPPTQFNQSNFGQFNTGLANPSWQVQNVFNTPPTKPFSPPPISTMQQPTLQPIPTMQTQPSLMQPQQPTLAPPPSASMPPLQPPRPTSTGSGQGKILVDLTNYIMLKLCFFNNRFRTSI